jgi:hypothetical protein
VRQSVRKRKKRKRQIQIAKLDERKKKHGDREYKKENLSKDWKRGT